MRFSSTPRGARLDRRLAATRLDAWGFPYGTPAHDDVTLIIAELCGNAVRHGQVPGRDFRLTMTESARAATPSAALRIEVTDTRTDRLPVPAAHTPLAETGRGLVIVAALAARWGWHPRLDGPGKTVWAECDVP